MLNMGSSSPGRTPQRQEAKEENKHRRGPLLFSETRFERILSVPPKLQFGLLRWTSEFDVCDKATLLGKALDVMVALYCDLLLQLSKTSASRERFIQAPTEFMVAPMYYCDRLLDGIVHSIADVRKNINRLNEELGTLHAKCLQNRNAAQKVCQEVEMDAKPEMDTFIEERKAKVAVFRELSERIRSVQGGENMYRFLDKPWCHSSAVCSQLATQTTTARPAMSNRKINEKGPAEAPREMASETTDKEQPGRNAEDCTPENAGPRQPVAGSLHLPQELSVPETPEQPRPLNSAEAPVTQVSSPRKKRSLSSRKRAREAKARVEDPPVARNLIQGAFGSSETDTPRGSKTAKKASKKSHLAEIVATEARGDGSKKGEDHVMKDVDGEGPRDSEREKTRERRRESGLQSGQTVNDLQKATSPKLLPGKAVSSDSQ